MSKAKTEELTQSEIEKTIFEELYQNLHLKDAKHDLFETKELTGTSQPIGKIRKPIMDITFGGCPECGFPVKATDVWRGETVCEGCGYVLTHESTEPNDYELHDTSPLRPETQITTAERNIIYSIKAKRQRKFQTTENFGNYKAGTQKSDWRKDRHYIVIDTISSMLMMNKTQTNECKEIVKNHSLHEFHSRANTNAILAGICRYVLEKDGRGRELRYTRDAFNLNGLTRDKYKVIKRNLDELEV
ncbi:MAG: TFIIB-type zinc ribbon-containing protein [Methanobacterium sp.]